MPVSSITNYTDLQSAVSDYLNRSDLAVQIPMFVQLAEREFNRAIRNRQMEVRETTVTLGGQAYYATPPDFLESRNFVLVADRRVPLAYKTPQQQEVLYPQNCTGMPETFTIYGQEFRLAPTPDGVYTIELFYYAEIPSLAANGTNWLLQKHPDLYLYGTLVQSAPFLRDDDQLQVWASLYTKGMNSLVDEEKREQWNSSPLTPNVDVYCP